MAVSKLFVAVIFTAGCLFAEGTANQAIKPNKTIRFDGTDVYGYLDNPSASFIVDADDPEAEPIYLDRSFRDALRDNMDKETFALQAKN